MLLIFEGIVNTEPAPRAFRGILRFYNAHLGAGNIQAGFDGI